MGPAVVRRWALLKDIKGVLEDIKGVLKHPLTLVKNMSDRDKNMLKRDKAPPLGLSDEDYETWKALQTAATGNQRCFAT
jgi:hypothetical protein